MKRTFKKTAVITLAAAMTAGLLAGCGTDKLDGTKTVATVNGTEIPMGVVSLYARQTQAQTEAMYMSFMGSADGIWSQVADEESGETFGQQTVKNTLEQVEQMYAIKEKAADYNVELSEDDEKAIAEAASQFMAANDEETIKELAVTEDQVKTLLELQTYRERMYQPLADEAKIEVTDEEAQQSSFTYVNVSINDENITDEEKEEKKAQAQEILDKVKEDPTADMGDIAKEIDESYSDLSGTFYTNESDDEDLTNYYPDEVIEALRTLDDGEVYDTLVEADAGYYILRLNKKNDEETSKTRKETIRKNRENEYFTETTQKWLDDAEVTVDDKVLATLTIEDNHTFSIKSTALTADETAEDEAEQMPEDEDMIEAEEPEGEEDAEDDLTAVSEEELEEMEADGDIEDVTEEENATDKK